MTNFRECFSKTHFHSLKITGMNLYTLWGVGTPGIAVLWRVWSLFGGMVVPAAVAMMCAVGHAVFHFA